MSQKIVDAIWKDKYAYGDEKNLEDTRNRVIDGVYAKDNDQKARRTALRLIHDDVIVPAGRIMAGAGTDKRVTLINCFGRNTRVITDKGIRVLGDMVGDAVRFLTRSSFHDGEVKHFGRQKLQEVEFKPAIITKNGKLQRFGRGKWSRKEIVTPDHRWLLRDSTWTTNLKVGDYVAGCRNHDVKIDDNGHLQFRDIEPNNDGIIHGLVFGDGSFVCANKNDNGRHYSLSIFGDKAAQYIGILPIPSRFPSHEKVTGYHGTCSISAQHDFKSVPSFIDPEYLAGFIIGWAAADGCGCSDDRLVIHSSNHPALEWLIEVAPIAGWIPIGYREDPSDETNYGKRKNRMRCVTLTKRPVLWYVNSIIDAGEDEVYCAVVPGPTVFTLAGGILTGNCFVSPTIQDSMDTEPNLPGKGIMDSLKDAALTQQMGGGIGMNFSTVRPNGALVKRTGSVSSGVLPFMDMWDSMCATVRSAGSRRGAMMGTLAIWHPDIEDFIVAKQKAGRLTNFNISVLVTDDFMEAVKWDKDWDLGFTVPRADNNHVALKMIGMPYVYKRIRARDLWNKIIENTYVHAEPGVIFIDRINQQNNLSYCETISCTNPCVTEDTWVQTVDGPRQVIELVGSSQFVAMVNGHSYKSECGFFLTGIKPVIHFATKEGYSLRLTPDHQMLTASGWKSACDITINDKVILHNHRNMSEWNGGKYGRHEGYLIGLLIGDGTIKDDEAVLSVWGHDGSKAIMDEALIAAHTLPHRSDFKGWSTVSGRNEFRMSTAAITGIAIDLGLSRYNKKITPNIERQSSDFYAGFLRGLFDSDGTVTGSQNKGLSIRLSQSNISLLEASQRMLLRLGIVSTIYRNRREASDRMLPDGNGGTKLYKCKAQHELVISNDNIGIFANRIGFTDSIKKKRLHKLIDAYVRKPNKETFTVTIESIEEVGKVPVYDVKIPGINAFDANGLYVHNCGEQPLPPNGDCNLGHVNLARMVKDPFTEHAKFDYDLLIEATTCMVRFLDNVIDIAQFPTEEQKSEALSKRRIGLGYTGLANALQQLGIVYGSDEAIEIVRGVGRVMRDAAYMASIKLAIERGPFPLFDKEQYIERPFIKTLPSCIRGGILQHGIRNGVLLTIAPTGTTSILIGNVSSGIEPVFQHYYDRKVRQDDGSFKTYDTVYDWGYLEYTKNRPDIRLPAAFITANELSVDDHLNMQAAAQEFVDASISKTINCPTEMSFEDFKDVYTKAYRLGLKGCTTYRFDPRSGRGAILTTEKKEEPKVDTPSDAPICHPKAPMEDVLEGRRYRIKWPDDDNAYYLNINDYIDPHGVRRPFECFISTKSVIHQPWISALTRTISAILRREDNVMFLAEELQQVHASASGGTFYNQKYVPSLVAMIGMKIEEHLRWLSLIKAEEPPTEKSSDPPHWTAGPPVTGAICERCQAPAVIKVDGCRKCTNCGHSNCG